MGQSKELFGRNPLSRKELPWERAARAGRGGDQPLLWQLDERRLSPSCLLKNPLNILVDERPPLAVPRINVWFESVPLNPRDLEAWRILDKRQETLWTQNKSDSSVKSNSTVPGDIFAPVGAAIDRNLSAPVRQLVTTVARVVGAVFVLSPAASAFAQNTEARQSSIQMAAASFREGTRVVAIAKDDPRSSEFWARVQESRTAEQTGTSLPAIPEKPALSIQDQCPKKVGTAGIIYGADNKPIELQVCVDKSGRVLSFPIVIREGETVETAKNRAIAQATKYVQTGEIDNKIDITIKFLNGLTGKDLINYLGIFDTRGGRDFKLEIGFIGSATNEEIVKFGETIIRSYQASASRNVIVVTPSPNSDPKSLKKFTVFSTGIVAQPKIITEEQLASPVPPKPKEIPPAKKPAPQPAVKGQIMAGSGQTVELIAGELCFNGMNDAERYNDFKAISSAIRVDKQSTRALSVQYSPENFTTGDTFIEVEIKDRNGRMHTCYVHRFGQPMVNRGFLGLGGDEIIQKASNYYPPSQDAQDTSKTTFASSDNYRLAPVVITNETGFWSGLGMFLVGGLTGMGGTAASFFVPGIGIPVAGGGFLTAAGGWQLMANSKK